MDIYDILRRQLERFYPYVEGIEQIKQVPSLLRESDDEFCFSFEFSAQFTAAVCSHGFYPMADSTSGFPLFLIKSHKERCVLYFENVKVPKRLIRYAKGLTITVDRAFDECLSGIERQHDHNWLIPELLTTFKSLHRNPVDGVSFHSVECWNGDLLMAGDIGFIHGDVFSGLSRFHSASSTGSVLLAATAAILKMHGFAFFDLGMPWPYKKKIGGICMQRHDFLSCYKGRPKGSVLLPAEKFDAQNILKLLKM